MDNIFIINDNNKKNKELLRLEKLQEDIQNDRVDVNSISEEDFVKVSLLYDNQILDISKQIEKNNKYIEVCKEKILKYKKG